MFPILFGLAAIGGLVTFAIKKATGPSVRERDERERLAKLEVKRALTLDEAEDGAVLARRYGARSQARFAREAEKLRKSRISI